MELALRTADGRHVTLGDERGLREAVADISQATGGSSAGGPFSHLFGPGPEEAMPEDWAGRLPREAIEFRMLAGAQLHPQTVELLDRLATLADE